MTTERRGLDLPLIEAQSAPGSGNSGTGNRVDSPRVPRAPIVSEALFAGSSEVQIAHRGALYRLKLTALGKLILTK